MQRLTEEFWAAHNSLTEGILSSDSRFDEILSIMGPEQMLEALIKWLPNDDVEAFLQDMIADYDIDYSENYEDDELI